MDDSELGEEVLLVLQNRGWEIERSSSLEPLLPPLLRQRYSRLPVELTRFLEGLERCVNPHQNVWFLCREDYRRTDEQSFRWNEQELMSLEVAQGDAMDQAQIRRFWDHHFPFMMAVHSDYDYLAISLEHQAYGAVMHGFAPEFEESASSIAPSFTKFLNLLKRAAAREETTYPLSLFL